MMKNDLPKDEVKRELYEVGKQLFDKIGYVEVGMDHFAALKQTLCTKRWKRKHFIAILWDILPEKTALMVGLGMSAISDSWYSFAQNVKTVEEYQEIVNQEEFPLLRWAFTF